MSLTPNSPALDDELIFAEEDDASVANARHHGRRWRVLIVDDDPGVHQSVVFALRDVVILDGRIDFLHAHSGHEARALLEQEQNIAVVLLDVVMEREDSGLTLVRFIREELHRADSRIILHTGQPGYAPEIEAIREYDINDYRTKSELTRNHLYTCIASAIRAFDQINAIELSRKQLRKVVDCGTEMMMAVDREAFLRTALRGFADLYEIEANGFSSLHVSGNDRPAIEYVTPGLQALQGQPLSALHDTEALHAIEQSLLTGELGLCAHSASLFIKGASGLDLLLHLNLPAEHLREHRIASGILEVFRSALVACLDNRSLLDRLHRYAYFDRLLNLPNRRSLCETIDGQRLSSDSGPQTLALIDIDHFGDTNEALGQVFGNYILLAVAERLSASATANWALARVSADSFAVLGPSDSVAPDALQALFLSPFVIEGEEAMVSVTIGLARLGDIPGDGAAVLEAASQALRLAKSRHRGHFAWYSPGLAQQTHDRVLMLNALRQALGHQELFVVFQPQIALPDKTVVGFEALVRWKNAEGKFIPPDRFIPVAEQSGLIRDVGLFVLRESCETLKRLHASGYPTVRMAVNVSALQFRHPRFLTELQAIIDSVGIDPHLLELEITESVAMEDAAQLREIFGALNGLGVQLAIDDFGTGYSSLSQLKRLSFDRLKIDRSFINDLFEGGPQSSIANMVIELGKRLGIQVIAEGVETMEQAETLRLLGCHEAQGYLFGRPMPESDLQVWLRDYQPD